jgi:hypothetical protein
MAAAARIATSSWKFRAMTCTPMGRPSFDEPARTTTQGFPDRLYGMV